MVPFTLWRGDLRVGEVVATLPAQAEFVVVGLFRPKADGGIPRSLIQTRILASGGVFLSPLAEGRRPGPHPLRPLSADDAPGLPPHQQLHLRDGAGDVVEIDVLMIIPRAGLSERRGRFLGMETHNLPCARRRFYGWGEMRP